MSADLHRLAPTAACPAHVALGMNRAFSAGRFGIARIPGALPQAASEDRAFGAKNSFNAFVPLTTANLPSIRSVKRHGRGFMNESRLQRRPVPGLLLNTALSVLYVFTS